tara:strand:+ start:127 stop:564 length:438 start_codon:yes stop_codon:yes gene_type:complete
MKKNSKYRQGMFVPQNLDKFIGERAVYRSGLELKFFRFCDMNPKVVRWGSENIKIPYHNPLTKRTHRYHIDNYVVIQEGEKITKYCVEIKPYSQTQRPKTKYRKKQHLIYDQKQYVINQSKWAAARKYCDGRGYSFLILTEKELS